MYWCDESDPRQLIGEFRDVHGIAAYSLSAMDGAVENEFIIQIQVRR